MLPCDVSKGHRKVGVVYGVGGLDKELGFIYINIGIDDLYMNKSCAISSN